MSESAGNQEQTTDIPSIPSPESTNSFSRAKAKIAGFLKRAQKPQRQTEQQVVEQKIDDSGYKALLGQIGSVETFNSVTFPGHSYKGKDLQGMMTKLYPELVKTLQINPEIKNDTGNELWLKGLYEGDKQSIVRAMDDLQRKLEPKVSSRTSPHDPNSAHLVYLKNMRAYLQGEIDKEKAAQELDGQKLNSQATNEINQVLAGALDSGQKEE
jgi:hypothetical protein